MQMPPVSVVADEYVLCADRLLRIIRNSYRHTQHLRAIGGSYNAAVALCLFLPVFIGINNVLQGMGRAVGLYGRKKISVPLDVSEICGVYHLALMSWYSDGRAMNNDAITACATAIWLPLK